MVGGFYGIINSLYNTFLRREERAETSELAGLLENSKEIKITGEMLLYNKLSNRSPDDFIGSKEFTEEEEEWNYWSNRSPDDFE